MTQHGVAAEGMKQLDGMDKIFTEFGNDIVNRSRKNKVKTQSKSK